MAGLEEKWSVSALRDKPHTDKVYLDTNKNMINFEVNAIIFLNIAKLLLLEQDCMHALGWDANLIWML